MTATLWCKPDPSLIRYLANRYPEITWSYAVRGEGHLRTPEEMVEWLQDQGYGKRKKEEVEDLE